MSMTLRSGVACFVCAGFSISLSDAQEPPNAFTYTTFSVPAAVSGLAVTSINDFGTISGSYVDLDGNTVSFIRTSGGTITPFSDPADTSSPTYTLAGQINDGGVIAGQFFDTAENAIIGFVYQSSTGTFDKFRSLTWISEALRLVSAHP